MDCTEHPGVLQHGVHWLLVCSEDHTPATTLILSGPPLWSQSLSTAELVSPLVCCSRVGLGRWGELFLGLLGCWQNLVPATVGLVFIFLLTVAQRQLSVGYMSTQSSFAYTRFLIHLLCQSKQEKKIDIATYAITSSLELSVTLAIFHWLESSHGSSHTQGEMLMPGFEEQGTLEILSQEPVCHSPPLATSHR